MANNLRAMSKIEIIYIYFLTEAEEITSSEMKSFCEIVGFGEVIWLDSVGTILGSHQHHDAMRLQTQLLAAAHMFVTLRTEDLL